MLGGDWTDGTMTDFKWRHFQGDVILWAVRWYCRYPISYRDFEEMLAERGISVAHTTIYRWVQCCGQVMEKRLRWFWRRGRRNVVEGKRGSGRVVHGGRRKSKTKNK